MVKKPHFQWGRSNSQRGFEPHTQHETKNKMSKIDKKKNKIKERIEELELELRESLTKKTSDTKEINVPLQQRKIQELKIQLSKI